MITVTAPVRIDLLGGTLDIDPINLVLQNVITLNMALSLEAKVKIFPGTAGYVKIKSLDYQNEYVYEQDDFKPENFYKERFFSNHFFKEMILVAAMLDHVGVLEGVNIELSSGSPAGAGLGGSSAMAMALYQALLKHQNKPFQVAKALRVVKNIEAKVISKGVTGYQDYYPGLYGGVLALKSKNKGVEVEQLYRPDLVDFFEKNMTLVYSDQTRFSGFTNWEVCKRFWDEESVIRTGLSQIATLSEKAYFAIRNHQYHDVLNFIIEEGKVRERLFAGILTPSIRNFIFDLELLRAKTKKTLGAKVCGAGGGGCFIVIGDAKAEIKELITKHKMTEIPFKVQLPRALDEYETKLAEG
jgi:D-glycero-alpha-D-manno-heptose-7-phosphate kinase